ncbi:MAG: VWA domain-containing protein [Acidobacteria bacterium]|nr:VWA domain-containing protein [Acidobacteriota bacterium]MBK8147219.1 VWA domain-containing protein [Acidobacteriota bacterium]MBK8810385.1 VWA domain-containing protein [Acidobacteriota bacterium]
MKRIGLILVGICLFGLTVAAQSGTVSRPRVVTSATPPVLKGGTTAQNDKKAPVLIGQTTSTPTPSETTTVVEDDNEVIKVETNLVTMPVSVLDRDGRFISGLQQRDFQVFENGIQQRVEYFQSVEQPFTVILMIDVSPSTQFKIEEIQDAAIAFVNQLRRDDKVMVISFDDKVNVLSPVTGDRRVLQNAIRQSRFGDGTSLYEAVDFVLKQQLRLIDGRKAVVLFTDGVDTTSRRANYQTTIRESEESDALFYPIRYDTMSDMNGGYGGGGTNYPRRQPSGGGIGSIIGVILGGGNVRVGRGGGSAGSSSAEYETGKRYLEDLARNSGGRSFEARNNLDAAFLGISEELRRQYSIGYYPEKAGQPGERRQIRVRVMRPNVVVKAKTSYVIGRK